MKTVKLLQFITNLKVEFSFSFMLILIAWYNYAYFTLPQLMKWFRNLLPAVPLQPFCCNNGFRWVRCSNE